jgi:TonB-linked SusC/RagA family outer membrane protein
MMRFAQPPMAGRTVHRRTHIVGVALAASIVVSSSAVAQTPSALPMPSAAIMPSPAPVGSIAGKVSDRVSGAPLVAVTVAVEGTNVGATTREDGTYRLTQVPAGARMIVARRVGYAPARRVVTVADNQDVTVDFQLTAAAASLEGVVTTATGQQRRIELGNTVATIDVAARADASAIKNVGDLLSAQATGVQVMGANTTGATNRIRIRGVASMSLSNDPIYVIDGIRMTNVVGGTGTGGGSVPSRVNDLNPDEVESIEVVKGPSAATLYGTDAANGVIVITTKRGRPGAAAWSFHGEHGTLDDRSNYLAQYALLGKSPGSNTQRRCFTNELATGACILDSATTLNIWKNSDLTPLKPGPRNVFGGSVSGGTNDLRYFISGDIQQEDGPFGLPKFDQHRFDSLGVSISDEMKRPSHLQLMSFRSNLNAVINPKLDVSLSAGLTLGDTRFPQNDNNTNGFVYNAVAGPGYITGPGYTGIGSVGEKLMGYAQMTPGEIFQKLSQQTVNRFIVSTTANWRPLSWLQGSADVGGDLTDRKDYTLQRLGEGPTTGTQLQGSATDARARIVNYTTNGRLTATWQARSWAQLKSTAGAQFVSFDLNSTTATGSQLAPGGETPSQGATYSVSAASTPSKTLGAYIEEQAALRDRLYITGAMRTDRNSAFGVNYRKAYYPKASLSWIVSDEKFFPSIPKLSQLRFRASVGSSGVQPAGTSALKTYAVGTVYFLGTAAAGLSQSNPGNANLKPERSTELESGIDTRWWGDRASFELTFYKKTTKDALVTQPVAPSAGVSSYLANIGGVQNTGWEYRLQAQAIDTRNVGLDFALSGSNNQNRVTALGNIITTATSNIQVGLPLYAVIQRSITYNDANNDGYLSNAEVTISPATAVSYRGPRFAPVQLAFNAGLDLLQHRVRVTALVDRRAGAWDSDLERQLPCLVGTSCPELQQLHPSLSDQARGIGLKQGVFAGYVERTDFTRLREIAATYDFGNALTNRFFASKRTQLTLAARNIKLWKKYWTGTDPEAFIANNTDNPANEQNVLTIAAPLYYMLRLNVNF